MVKESAERAKMRKATAAAFSGDVPWLDQMIRDAGYTRETDRPAVTQVVLCEIAEVHRKVVLDWEKGGFEVDKIGRRKRYDLGRLVRFLIDRNRKGEGTSEMQDARQTKIEVDTELKRLQLKERLGTMMERSEAERLIVSMCLEAKAGLLALPASIAASLAHQDEKTIRDHLRNHINWLLDQMASNGKVEVPAGAVKEIRAIIKREVG